MRAPRIAVFHMADAKVSARRSRDPNISREFDAPFDRHVHCSIQAVPMSTNTDLKRR